MSATVEDAQAMIDWLADKDPDVWFEVILVQLRQPAKASSSAFATLRSFVSKPSVNLA